jgi:hypothetical protein
MNRLRCFLAVALLGGALFAVAGCWSDNPNGTSVIKPPEEQSNPRSVYDTDTRQREAYISAHLKSYMDHARPLPGSTEFLQRLMLASVFDELSNVLPMLAGSEPSAIFRQQFRVIQSTHQQISALPLDTSSDTIVESGLRGASDALEDLSTTVFADHTEMATDINNLNSKIDEMDTAPTETHRQVEADAIGMIGRIMLSMNAVLNPRLGAGPTPSTRPATRMTNQPASAPRVQQDGGMPASPLQ